MKNLTHMSVQGISPPEAKADDGDDGTFWTEYLMSEALSKFVPAGNGIVEEGMWNFGVEEGVWNYGVVEEESIGAGKMVGAAGSNSQGSPPVLREQGPVSNEEEYSRFVFHLLQSSSFAVGVSGSEVGPERMVGGAPPPGSMDKSVLTPTGGGSHDGYGGFPSQVLQSVVGVEAPRENLNLGKKRAAAAARMGSAPPRARASKRQRTLSGSIETSHGSTDEEMGSEFSHLMAAAVAALGNVCRIEPVAVWWRDTVNSPGYTDADFKRDFHISRSTFDYLCKNLASSVGKYGHRATITVPQRVAICVFCLATGAHYRELSERFDICISICHKTVREVAAAIKTIFQLRPDSAKDMDSAAEKFQALTGGIPGVIGAVYTTHLRIIAPGHHVSKYYNRRLTERRKGKATYSLTLHAAVDADGAFIDICAGNPGTMSDEEIFSLWSMNEKRAVDQMVAQGKRFVGGAGYPLTDWTLVPYTHGNLTLPQREFNKKLALARGVALDAFQRLKARWACLRLQPQERPVGKKLEYLSSEMEACCVLHNLCERRGDELGDELKGFELQDDEMLLDNPVRSDAAAQVRDAIAHNLLHGSTIAVPTTTK